jgi:hypothetical protein
VRDAQLVEVLDPFLQRRTVVDPECQMVVTVRSMCPNPVISGLAMRHDRSAARLLLEAATLAEIGA